MKFAITIFIFVLVFLTPACIRKNETQTQAETQTETAPTEAQTKAADEASLLAAAKESGVSEADALAAKAELDKVYDEAAAKMDEAENERNARFKQLSDDACVANCADE